MSMEYQSLDPDKNEIRVLTLLSSHHSSDGSSSVVRCTLENVLLEPLTGIYHLRSRPVQGSFGCHWEDRFARKAEPALRRVMTTPNEDVDQDPGLGKGKQSFQGRYPWGEYVALSYVWGNSDNMREISINGKPVQVTKNLESALRILRDKLPMRLGVRLWVDALCINQKDIMERNTQVQRMWEIYNKALEVVVWLGEEAEDTWKAIKLIKILSLSWKKDEGKELATLMASNPKFSLASYQISGGPGERHEGRGRRHQKRQKNYHLRSTGSQEPSLFECWYSLRSLMRREYWNRVWVLQELSAGAKDTPIFCGRSVVFYEDLLNAAIKWIHGSNIDLMLTLLVREELSEHELRDSTFDAEKKDLAEGGWITTGNLELTMKFQEVRRKDCWPPPLDVLAAGRDLDATDPRDKIYGFMALIHPYFVKDLKPNYELPVEQVYTDFCIALMQAEKSLSFLSHCNWTPAQNTTPSWVPDWSQKLDIGSPFLGVMGKAPNPYFGGGPCFLEEMMGCFPVPSPDKKKLKVLCLLTDQIDGLSMNPFEDGSDAQPTQPTTQNNHYGDEEGCREALWRTFLCNRTYEHVIPQSDDQEANVLMDVRLPQDNWTWSQNEILFYTFIVYNHAFCVADKPLGRYFTRKVPHQNDIRQKTEQGSRKELLLQTAVANVCKNRLFTTHMGFVGICPPSARSGDMVGVLLGCSVPLVLRPHGNEFKVIGACYAQGIMQGEVMDLLTGGKINPNKTRGIVLC